jgi:hypothetical protein
VKLRTDSVVWRADGNDNLLKGFKMLLILSLFCYDLIKVVADTGCLAENLVSKAGACRGLWTRSAGPAVKSKRLQDRNL